MIKIISIPAFLFIAGSLLLPLLREKIKKVFVMLIPLIALLNILSIKPGTIYKFKFLNFQVVPLYADKLSLIVGYIFIIIGFFAILYSLHENNNIFTVVSLLYVGTALGVVFAGDFLTLYIFWELLALAGAGLVLLNTSKEAINTAFRYLVMHLMGGLLLLGGIWLYYMENGTLLISKLEGGWPLILIVAGIGVNAAFVLVHTWLPDSYPKAPYYASVFMSVYTTKTAVYALARTAPGWEFIAYMGAAMAVFGVTMALMQNNARKLLSYHIVSQVGYMVAAIGLGGAFGINGGILHLVNHILYKSLLFMTIGAVIYVTGEERLDKLGGLARKMPVTTICAIVASMSISGMPLFNGFVSKKLIFEAAHLFPNYSTNLIVYLLLELAAVGTFLSFMKFTYYGFLKPNPKLEATAHEAPLNMNIAMGGVAFLCILIGAFPGLILSYLPLGAHNAFYDFKSIMVPLQLVTVSGLAFYFGRKKVFIPHNRLTFDFDTIYIKIVESMAFIPAMFSTVNDWVEAQTIKIPGLLGKLKKPISITVTYLTDFLFAIWVDFWLFSPTADLQGYQYENEKDFSSLTRNIIFRPFNIIIKFMDNIGSMIAKIATRFDSKILDFSIRELLESTLFNTNELSTRNRINAISTVASKFDDKILDKTSKEALASTLFSVDELSTRNNTISSMSNMFDKLIVDGFINAIALIVFYMGERARRVQTGLVQNYALIIIFIVSIFIIILSVRGGF